MVCRIKRIGKENSQDIHLPNEPFLLFGRMLPAYSNGEWSFTTQLLEQSNVQKMVFPDEHYHYEKLSEKGVMVGAYDEAGACVGLAIYQYSWNKYLYLYDLKVNASYRGKGIGRALIEEGKKIAAENGYHGIYTQAQDNNLGACLFYVNTGFQIGGLDTMLYQGTKQEGKSDIIFYLHM